MEHNYIDTLYSYWCIIDYAPIEVGYMISYIIYYFILYGIVTKKKLEIQ